MAEHVLYGGMEIFKNPNLVPLEELTLEVKTDGVAERTHALDRKWIEERYFLRYEAPEVCNEDGSEIIGAKQRWIDIVKYIIEDLNWLLCLPFYKFWSNVVYNPSILDTLVSFLQEAPPFYALENFPRSSEMLEQLEELRRCVLVIFTRLITNKESPMEYMNRPFFGKLLYDNYIFTIPIIFDLCQLYGRENGETIEKILKCIFELQPLYNDDLQKSVPYLIEALGNVEQRFEDRAARQIPEAIPMSDGINGYMEITVCALEDMILYILDISSNLTVLLKNYHPAIRVFHNEDFMTKIVSIYECTIPNMYKRLDKLSDDDENMPKFMELKHRLDVSRVELLQLFRTIIHEPLLSITKKLHAIEDSEVKERVDKYLAFLSNIVSEKEFITDYNQFYPINEDLQLLSTLCPDVDTIKCEYLLHSIYATIGDDNVPTIVQSDDKIDAIAGPSGIQSSHSAECTNDVQPTGRANRSEINSVELMSLVSEVKDILCELGEGFIELCLKHYNYDSASVINAVLENNLPPNLKELDYTLPHIPPDPMEPSAAVDRALNGERLNIFDNDEFDIMTRDVIDMSKVYLGKKREKYRNIDELLNNKSEIRQASEIYSKYSLVADDYDDEYDDTYDSHNARDTAQDESVEIDSRAFTTPRVLLAKEKRDSVSEEDAAASEEENAMNEENDKNQFVANPAELRAKAEQRMRSFRGEKTTSDATGKPKGRGQDKGVLVVRDQKNRHKSTRANHNRRSGAQWKQRQGMIPS
ncbi:hypothetical protein KM043_012319 [Ampulex compressa]|nr:hypothetical protein KM043_012319 [Ampulex compressa]